MGKMKEFAIDRAIAREWALWYVGCNIHSVVHLELEDQTIYFWG